MQTELLRPDADGIHRAAQALAAGELVAFPTETVYGLGANALDDGAVRAVFSAKGRPLSHPLIVHLAEGTDLAEWTRATGTTLDQARQLQEAFWPGPLTLVLPRSSLAGDTVTAAQPTVALRVPDHPVAQELLSTSGLPLVAPSANRYGRLSPTMAQHVLAQLDGRIRFVVDGGPAAIGLESTILDLSGAEPRVLRPGQISATKLADVLGVPVLGRGCGNVPRVPGAERSHYAPRAATRIVDSAELAAAVQAAPLSGVLAFEPAPAGFRGRWLQMPPDPQEYGRQLYRRLHELDGITSRILIERPPDSVDWLAVNDRLRRAASGKQEGE